MSEQQSQAASSAAQVCRCSHGFSCHVCEGCRDHHEPGCPLDQRGPCDCFQSGDLAHARDCPAFATGFPMAPDTAASEQHQNTLMREALRRIAENGEAGLWPGSWQSRHARETLMVVEQQSSASGAAESGPVAASHAPRCEHTEHAMRSDGQYGRFFPEGTVGGVGKWEPCPVAASSATCMTLLHPSLDLACGQPAVAYIRLFCVHEHDRGVAVCSDDLAATGADWGHCLSCYQHPERSHWCPLRVVETTALASAVSGK